MKYYKDTYNNPFAFEDNVTQKIIAKVEATHNTKLTAITEAEYKVIIAPTFEQLKDRKIGEIKSEYQKQLKQGYTCSNGIRMDAEKSKVDMLKDGYDLAVKLGLTTMDIRDYDNVVHSTIAVADVDTMLTELGSNISTQLSKKWMLEKQVNSATTQSDLDLIGW